MWVIMAKLIHIVKGNFIDNMDYYGYIFGMARPPKDPADRKSMDVRIPMTEEQKRLVLAAAANADADVATWARPILLAAAQQRTAKGRHKQ
jgi:hypothetical protein